MDALKKSPGLALPRQSLKVVKGAAGAMTKRPSPRGAATHPPRADRALFRGLV